MITEDYVSFETAKLLKEKGFDAPCRSNYRSKYKDYKVPFYHNAPKNFNDKEYEGLNSEWFSAPTLQMAMKWLREVHNIHIVMYPYTDKEGQCWTFIFNKYAYDCWQELGIYITDYWNSYEEAAEVAIKYCLEHLI